MKKNIESKWSEDIKKTTREVLSQINCNDKTEEKNKLTYLSRARAWWIVKEYYPYANYEVVKYDWRPYLFDENLGYLVTTRVIIEWEIIEMNLPIMDSKNKSMKSIPYTYDTKWSKWNVVEAASMFDINTAIMRCLTKNLAMFGLWHYIYAWEDLPEEKTTEENKVHKEMPLPTPIPESTNEETKKIESRSATMIDEWQLQLIRDFMIEFSEQLDQEAFLFAIRWQVKIDNLSEIKNLWKLDASKVIRYLVTLATEEIKSWKEIKNEKIKALAEKQMGSLLNK